MKEYFVALEVIYPIFVEANNEEEAVEIAVNKCPYDINSEPAVNLSYCEENKEKEKG